MSSPYLPPPSLSADKYECSNEVLGSGAFAVVKTCYSRKDHLQLAAKVWLAGGRGWRECLREGMGGDEREEGNGRKRMGEGKDGSGREELGD